MARSLQTSAVTLTLLTAPALAQDRSSMLASPARMKPLGTVDERYQSYNVEMLEVTGGRFWKPYKDIAAPAKGAAPAERGNAPAGMDPGLYQYRPPIDLANPRLRKMAQALGPAYMRISGTWANTTFFDGSDTPPEQPPRGYNGVLTKQQWLGAIAFSKAVDAPIVTSMPLSDGTRGPGGVWQPDQARGWLAFTKANGGTIAAAEYFNEPTLASMGGASKDYDAAAFGRDYKVFEAFMRKEFPQTKLLAPGSVGEATAAWGVAMGREGTYEHGGFLRAAQDAWRFNLGHLAVRGLSERRRQMVAPPFARTRTARLLQR